MPSVKSSFLRPAFPARRGQNRGVALVVTLMMLSVLVMMVVGLAGVMRNEQAAARNLTYQVLAEQLAEIGAREAMAAVYSNSMVATGRPAATGPGWVFGNYSNQSLFSSNPSGQTKNLDSLGTNSLILSLPSGGNVRGNLPVSWSNMMQPGKVSIGRYAWWVDDEGTKVNLNAVGSNNVYQYLPWLTPFPVSADWIFVDPVGLTTNGASASRAGALRRRSGFLPTTESIKETNLVNPTPATNQIGGGTYRQIKDQITVWSSNLDLSPWGAAKLNLADPNLTAAQIKNAMTTNAWTNYFSPNMNLARKYGGGGLTAGSAGNPGDIVMDQITQNILTSSGKTPTINLHTGNNDDNDPLRHRNGISINPVGLTQTPFLSEVAASVSSRDVGGNLRTILVTFYFEVEIYNPWSSPSAGNYTLELYPRKMRFHIASGNPNVSANTVPGPSLDLADAFGSSAGKTGAAGCWAGPDQEDGCAWPSASPLTAVVPSLSAKSWRTVSLSQSFSCIFPGGTTGFNPGIVVDQAYLKIDKVLLKNPAGNLVDWVTLDDFAQASGTLGNYGSNNTTRTAGAANDLGQLNFTGNSYPATQRGPNFIDNAVDAVASATPSAFSVNGALGLAKNDPRVRLPMIVWGPTVGSFRANGFSNSLLPWRRVSGGGGAPAITPGAANTGVFDAVSTNGTVTGISYLWPDPVTNGTTILTHPHFVPGYSLTNGFRSVAQLGSIHTGLPWRTLRFQPLPAVERAAANGATNSPPDWILLDVFTVTNPSASLPMINPNGLPHALNGLAVNSDGSVSSRARALLSAMGTAANPLLVSNPNHQLLLIANGVPLSLTNTNNSYPRSLFPLVASNLAAVLSNPASTNGWSTNSSWRLSRGARPTSFPSNGLILRGEILEIGGIAESPSAASGLGEDAIEGRLRSFLDMVTTRSDTFSVWSIGQGFSVVTNASGNPIRTNIMGEVKKQTVFQRFPAVDQNGNWRLNPDGSLAGWQLRVLYTRNHVVE